MLSQRHVLLEDPTLPRNRHSFVSVKLGYGRIHLGIRRLGHTRRQELLALVVVERDTVFIERSHIQTHRGVEQEKWRTACTHTSVSVTAFDRKMPAKMRYGYCTREDTCTRVL